MTLNELGLFITQQLGSYVNGVYPGFAPENVVWPCAVYILEETDRNYLLDGTPVSIATSHVKLEIAGFDAAEIDIITATAKQSLNGHRGLIGGSGSGTGFSTVAIDDFASMSLDNFATDPLDGGTAGNLFVIFKLKNEAQESVPYGDGDDTWLTIRSLSFLVRHSYITTA